MFAAAVAAERALVGEHELLLAAELGAGHDLGRRLALEGLAGAARGRGGVALGVGAGLPRDAGRGLFDVATRERVRPHDLRDRVRVGRAQQREPRAPQPPQQRRVRPSPRPRHRRVRAPRHAGDGRCRAPAQRAPQRVALARLR